MVHHPPSLEHLGFLIPLRQSDFSVTKSPFCLQSTEGPVQRRQSFPLERLVWGSANDRNVSHRSACLGTVGAKGRKHWLSWKHWFKISHYRGLYLDRNPKHSQACCWLQRGVCSLTRAVHWLLHPQSCRSNITVNDSVQMHLLLYPHPPVHCRCAQVLLRAQRALAEVLFWPPEHTHSWKGPPKALSRPALNICLEMTCLVLGASSASAPHSRNDFIARS